MTLAGQRRREVTLAGQRRREVTLAGQRRREVTLAGQRRHEVTLAGQRRREITLAGQRRCEVTLAGQRRREVTLAGQRRREVTCCGPGDASCSHRHQWLVQHPSNQYWPVLRRGRHDASRPWLGRHDENRPWLVRYDESRFWLGRHDESRFWLGRPVMRLRIGGHFVTGFGSGGYYRRIVLMWRRRAGSNTIGTSRSNITRAGSRESTGVNSPVSYTGRSQKQE